MRQKTTIIIILIFNSLLTMGQSLVIYDEFDSTQLDLKIWRKQGFNPNFHTDMGKQIFRPQNVVLQDGMLKLILKDEPGCYDSWRFCDSANCNSNCVSNYRDPMCGAQPKCEVQGDHCLCLVPKYFKYTAGMITSVEKFHYGVFEIKCKIPKDTWPAFWMFGDCCSEIDIFEFLGCQEDRITTTIHKCHDKKCSNKLSCAHKFKGWKNPTEADLSKDFHTWKLDWKPESLAVYLDDKLIYSCKSNGLGACLFNTFNLSDGSCTIGTHTLYPNGYMQMIANIATNPSDCTPPTPSVFEIEYIVSVIKLELS